MKNWRISTPLKTFVILDLYKIFRIYIYNNKNKINGRQ